MRKRSFTLAEVLLASAILIVALSIILLEFITCAVMNQSNRNTTRATSHVQYVLEDIINTPFANVAPQITAGAWDFASANITALGMSPLSNEAITTTYLSPSGGTFLEISVNAVWTEHRARARNLLIKTQLSQP